MLNMTAPVRLQRRRSRGYDMQAESRAANGLAAGSVCRPGPWGNPYRVGEPVDMRLAKAWGWKLRHPEYICADTEDAVRKFRAALSLDDASIYAIRKELRGHNLACWCPLPAPGEPDHCHAAVLLEIANR